jgi:Domain of unknown function (DUF4917)
VSKLLAFDEALALAESNDRSVLLGNGFSIAQSGGDFSYRSLLDRADIENDDPLRAVFKVFNTVDFEEVVRALEHAAEVERAYGDDSRCGKFLEDASRVREALIHAVRDVHPSIQFEVPDDQKENCHKFLSNFSNIFTINYDLLLYWVTLSAGGFADGFGLGAEVNGFRRFSESARCSVFYLHGALHLFLDETRDTLKKIVRYSTILDEISGVIRTRKRLPLFVAEGTSSKKLGVINSVPYLRYCYDKLSDLSGDLFIFGHSAAENDKHIYEVIFRQTSKVNNVYMFVYKPEDNISIYEERLAPYLTRNSDVNVRYIDSATAKVW